METIRSTTVIAVRRNDEVAMAGDGQVSLGETVLKGTASKIRLLRDGEILTGFAGSTADAFALLTRFESKLDEYNGNLFRASVELAKDWRTDRALRHLEALLVVADRDTTLMISGSGDLVEPDDGIIAIGSGGPFALAAARAMMRFTRKPARAIAKEALKIASEICVFSNSNISIESLR